MRYTDGGGRSLVAEEHTDWTREREREPDF